MREDEAGDVEGDWKDRGGVRAEAVVLEKNGQSYFRLHQAESYTCKNTINVFFCTILVKIISLHDLPGLGGVKWSKKFCLSIKRFFILEANFQELATKVGRNVLKVVFLPKSCKISRKVLVEKSWLLASFTCSDAFFKKDPINFYIQTHGKSVRRKKTRRTFLSSLGTRRDIRVLQAVSLVLRNVKYPSWAHFN